MWSFGQHDEDNYLSGLGMTLKMYADGVGSFEEGVYFNDFLDKFGRVINDEGEVIYAGKNNNLIKKYITGATNDKQSREDSNPTEKCRKDWQSQKYISQYERNYIENKLLEVNSKMMEVQQ